MFFGFLSLISHTIKAELITPSITFQGHLINASIVTILLFYLFLSLFVGWELFKDWVYVLLYFVPPTPRILTGILNI